jgi:plastocyanin
MRLTWLIAAAGVAVTAACGGGGNSTPTGPRVTIRDFSFSPSALTVKAGTTVTWGNSGPSTHTTTSDTMTWDSPTLVSASGGDPYGGGGTPAGIFSFTFNTPGTYNYHCSSHPPASYPGFTGTITVTP